MRFHFLFIFYDDVRDRSAGCGCGCKTVLIPDEIQVKIDRVSKFLFRFILKRNGLQDRF